MKRYLAYIFIILGLGITIFVVYRNSGTSDIRRTFSPYTLLSSSWEEYKSDYINSDGRVIDPSQNNITTSEGQSYAMLRSVWMDDKETFDRTWQWSKDNLRRPDDMLFGWKWGRRDDTSYGFMPDGGENAASDADSDIALALILASRRWHDTSYLDEARPIIDDLWEINTAVANGQRYLIAGNWADQDAELIINPSYFAPYAWRIFATIDKKHNWNSLINPAYTLLVDAGEKPLDKEKGVGLPPDWIAINKVTGEITAVKNVENFTTNYSYDAIRVPLRIAIDYLWNNDQQALAYLEGSFNRLEEGWQNRRLIEKYAHDGQALSQNESPSMYATALAYFMIVHPEQAEDMYQKKIITLYSNDENTFNKNLGYYEQNLLWFGAALYNKQIQNYES